MSTNKKKPDTDYPVGYGRTPGAQPVSEGSVGQSEWAASQHGKRACQAAPLSGGLPERQRSGGRYHGPNARVAGNDTKPSIEGRERQCLGRKGNIENRKEIEAEKSQAGPNAITLRWLSAEEALDALD